MVIVRVRILFIVSQLEHVEHCANVGAQGTDMGRVVHAKRRRGR